MKSRVFILFAGAAQWRIAAGGDSPAIAAVDLAADSAPETISARVASALESLGHRGQGVILALPPSLCLSAVVRTAGLPARQRQRALVYRLEEKLPVAAEEIVADFVSGDEETLGVCCRRTDLAPLVDALEAQGVPVATICPASLLALQALLDGSLMNVPNRSPDAIIWPSPNAADRQSELELFVVRDGRPHGWYVFPNRSKDLLFHLAMALPPGRTPGAEISLAISGLSTDARAALSHRSDLRISEISAGNKTPQMAATSLAAPILNGQVRPWIDLRRDALAVRDPLRQVRTPLTFAAVAVVLCLLISCAAMLWRASRYDTLANRYADEQRTAYREAFATGPIPADVRSRLEAEERHLRGLSGDDSAPPATTTGLVTLLDLIARLPADRDLRYRVLEVRLDDNRFALEGQATSHGDADTIVAALKRGAAFAVEPPRTEQLSVPDASDAKGSSNSTSKGVSFTISGTVKNSTAPRAGGAGK